MKIERSLAFERHLLAGPQVTPKGTNQVRPSIAPVRKNIPIGARGRKRNTVMFIGITPNIDGRQLTTPPVRQQTSGPLVRQQTPGPLVRQPVLVGRQTANQPISPIRQPAKRTYGRATSTPFASVSANHRPRLLSFPAPDKTLLIDNANDESLRIEQFDDTFGHLHYDSSE